MTSLDNLNIPSGVLTLVPRAAAAELCVLPVSIDNDAIVVAVPEQSDARLVSDLEFMLGKKVRALKVPSGMLMNAIQNHYGISDVEVRRTSVTRAAEILPVGHEEPAVEPTSDGSVVALANGIISDAIRMCASDIHVEPYERNLRVRYRLDGVLHKVLELSLSTARPLISRLKIMADLDIAEKRRPQDGRIRAKEGERTIDIRVSSLPTNFGEKIVLRILDKSQIQLDLSKLGFEEPDLRLVRRTLRLPYGMILVTGPTGSGKTTTLYAALNSINRSDINITTIEDPIEYDLPGINQTHVRSEIGLTFAAALRSILRQDPNVIMVGEIRDQETAEIAIRAALTGHLVFSTLHTNDAPSSIVRLIDMGVEPFLVASSVKMILAQRLIRKLCDKCKRAETPGQEITEEIGTSSLKDPMEYYGAEGCPACHQSGYKGRTAVFEILPIRDGLGELIARGATAEQIRSRARGLGMVSLRDAALQKADRGETSLDEVVRETSIASCTIA
jgi:type IV pilus assembly protein PilB